MRMVKSSLAVFICLVISSFLPGTSATKGFYMAIAAVLCIQPDMHNSIKKGMQRLLGTALGAMMGFLTMLLVNSWPGMPQWLRFAIFSLFVLLCIYVNILIKSPDSSYITTVIYLSIVLAHFAKDDLLGYVSYRFLETTLGILVAIAINLIPLGSAKQEAGQEEEE